MPALTGWRTALQHNSSYAFVLMLPVELMGLPPSLNKTVAVDKAVNAWVCQGVKCLPEIDELRELLRVCEIRGKIAIPL